MDTETAADAPWVVLDTNIVLDWLVFADGREQPLVHALLAGQLRWVACAAMRCELAHMLGHRSLADWSPDAAAALSVFDQMAVLRAAPATVPRPGLRCSDADDQVFIDLAISEAAQWLLTHDRALLKLTRRAAKHGVRIARPCDWTAQI